MARSGYVRVRCCAVVWCGAVRCELDVKAVEEGAVVRVLASSPSISSTRYSVFRLGLQLLADWHWGWGEDRRQCHFSRGCECKGRQARDDTRRQEKYNKTQHAPARHDHGNRGVASRDDAMIYRAVRDD